MAFGKEGDGEEMSEPDDDWALVVKFKTDIRDTQRRIGALEQRCK